MQAGIIGGAVLEHLMPAPVLSLPALGAILLVLPEVCTGMKVACSVGDKVQQTYVL